MDSFPKVAPSTCPQHLILGLPSQGGVEIVVDLIPARSAKMRLSPQPSTSRHSRQSPVMTSEEVALSPLAQLETYYYLPCYSCL
jgi:hypothetical protein